MIYFTLLGCQDDSTLKVLWIVVLMMVLKYAPASLRGLLSWCYVMLCHANLLYGVYFLAVLRFAGPAVAISVEITSMRMTPASCKLHTTASC